MIPPKVLDAVYEQLRPLIYELSKYTHSKDNSIRMDFGIGAVTFEFK